MISINYLAIIVCAILMQALGAGWYGVFAGSWARALGKSVEQLQAQMGVSPYVIAILGALLLNCVLAVLIEKTKTETWTQGALLGLWTWAGFVMPSLATHYAFAGLSPTLTLVDASHTLLALLLCGVILTLWRKRSS